MTIVPRRTQPLQRGRRTPVSDLRPTVGGVGTLTDLEREVLDFAGRRYRYAGAREAAIREELRLSPTRYAQVVNGLLDRPEALAYAPSTVKRLQRLRDQARRGRSLRQPLQSA